MIMKRGFNTSHVVVYPGIVAHYICKYLFQYISCCSLSRYNTPCCVPFNCFNTSHVVVYLIGTMIGAACDVCFNTSHVVVYRYMPAL